MNVSRETGAILEKYADLLREWSAKINLVSPTTIDDLDRRHLLDSEQLLAWAGDWHHWCDIGSGGGLPGLVIAAHNPDKPVTLIESDQRKAVFLRHAARSLHLNVTVISERIEVAAPQAADIVSARALAPLQRLIPLALRHAHKTTRFIFPKGAQWRQEVSQAQVTYAFDVDARPSITDKDATILILENIQRV